MKSEKCAILASSGGKSSTILMTLSIILLQFPSGVWDYMTSVPSLAMNEGISPKHSYYPA